MDKNRVVALSDGVIAIIMTIMVLELKTPVSGGWNALLDDKFVLISYVISFTATYYFWTVHHDLFKSFDKIPINSAWINAIYLLTLSFLPFTTSWVGRFLWAVPAELTYSVNFLLITATTLWFEHTIKQDLIHVHQAIPETVLKSSCLLKLTLLLNFVCCLITYLWAPTGIIAVAVILTVWIWRSVSSAAHEYSQNK